MNYTLSLWYESKTNTIGILQTWADGTRVFEIPGTLAPVIGAPDSWEYGWEFVGEL
jgi:hypothetical protein